MTSSPSPVQLKRLQDRQKLNRLMAGLLVGSGLLHGLAIALLYLQPAKLVEKPPEEIEIVLKERDPITKIDNPAPSEITTTSGSSGGDETLQVATLNPSDPAPPASETTLDTAPPEELSDQDLANLDLKVAIDAKKKKPNADQSKSSADGKGNKDDKGSSNGSDLRGLAPESGKGAGTGNQTNGNGGDGPKGKGKNDGGKDKTTASPTPSPTTTPSPISTPKPSEAPVAIVPKPNPPEAPPKKETPKSPAQNFSYEDKEGERLATGSTGSFVIELDKDGRSVIRPQGSVGDKELDAAQLRSLNRALEDDPELRQQIEANRGKTFKFKFEGEGETAAEREQIRRNEEIMRQQPAPEAPSSTAAEPEPAGIGLPIEAPIAAPEPQPETPAAPPADQPPTPEEPPARTEPVYEAPVAAPEAPPVYEEPTAPPEPVIPEEPVHEAPVEPPPVEAPPAAEPPPATEPPPAAEPSPAAEPPP